MTTISLRVSDEEEKLIKEYVSLNNLTLSSFVREAVLEKIEEDLKLDEARILKDLERSRKEETYDHTEVWRMLGME